MIQNFLRASAVSLLLSVSVNAFPILSKNNSTSVRRLTAMSQGAVDNYNFEGIVALSNCSGSLIQLAGASDADHALVLTNGHCLETGFSKPGQFVFGQASHRTFSILDKNARSLGTVTATEVVYSTMTNTDITIYKLKETYSQIISQFGIRPLALATTHPQTNTPMEIISGYWRRGYTCQMEAFIPELQEAGWSFKDSIRYSRPGCETIGGTSGSPILEAGTRTVIGINNTGNEDGQRCTMNNPCEVDSNGNVTFTKGMSYGQQTYWIYSCLNSSRELDLNVPGCLLPH